MALGLLLWVSWICFLLFGFSSGLPATRGHGYPHKSDYRNIGADTDDDALMFDDSTWQESDHQPSDPNYKPAAAQWPEPAAPPQSLPNNPSPPEVERPVTGGSGYWGKPETLQPSIPSSPNYRPAVPVKPQPGPVKPQSGGVSTVFVQPSSSFVSQQPSQDQDSNSGSSGSGSTFTRLVYEDVFQYPSENKPEPAASTNRMPAPPAGVSTAFARPTTHVSAPSSGFQQPEPVYNVAGTSVSVSPNQDYKEEFRYPSRIAGPSGTAQGYNQGNYMRPPTSPAGVSTAFAPSSGQGTYRRPSSQSFPNIGKYFESRFPQKPAISKQKVTKTVSEPSLPPLLPRRIYIVQSRNGYQRARYLHTATSYTQPTHPIVMMPIRAKAVKGKAAAPKGVKNPQRTNW
ncbi:uncharacterized protein LOC131982622 [Centropristis striata]|uniref:uncharacterized protein LOC131982622 n=1 Tax=Centropristis striata TaxID=184440 RepID=UPI0027DF50DF|nr:uncharacterized protein LOC131982622 [Centropristis striata]